MGSALGYRFRDDLALADLAFEAWGKTPAELFQNAALALISSLVDPKTVKHSQKYQIEKEAPDFGDLLFGFLEEILYLKDADGIVFAGVKVKIRSLVTGPAVATGVKADRWLLVATLPGEPINPNRHRLYLDVKAVTKHNFKIWQESGLFRCLVVVDV